ncbi:hypothetical protein ACMBCM_09725, partial [Spiroplasma sp. K1]
MLHWLRREDRLKSVFKWKIVNIYIYIYIYWNCHFSFVEMMKGIKGNENRKMFESFSLHKLRYRVYN